METSLVINTKIIESRRYFLAVSIYFLFFALLALFLAIFFKWLILSWIIILISWLSPVLFQSRFRKRFTKNINFNFNENFVVVKMLNKNLDIDDVSKIMYDEIKSFRAIKSSKDDTSFLKLIFKNGFNVSYTFIEQGNVTKNRVDIVDEVFKIVNSYNDKAGNNSYDKILLIPNFFATNMGKVCINILLVILLLSIAIQTLYEPKAIPVTLITAICFYLIILSQKRKDLELLKRMK